MPDWSETAAAAAQRPSRGNLAALLVLALVAAFVFRGHLLGQATFVGDGDRLNSFLNMRLFEVDSLRARQAQTWNESNFMGFSASSLHYMVPGADPVAYVEALLPRNELFRAAGYVSMTLLALAGWTAYLFIRSATGDRLTALLGAALYETAVFAIARVTQVDPAFLVLILTPLAMLAVRGVKPGRRSRPFATLAVLLSVLILSTFLQEAAYAVIVVGSYALYRGLRWRSWQPVAIFLGALLVGVVIGIPRVVTVFGEVQGLDRHATFHTTSPSELLRWFNDGIFGRFPSEARAVGNAGMNLREGLQLHASVLATLLILAGALRYRGAVESFATVGLLVVLGLAAGPLIGRPAAFVMLGLLMLAHMLLWVLAGLRSESPSKAWSEPLTDDVAFHMLFVGFTLAVVLLRPVNYLFHLAFLQLDFTHSRFSLAGLLPACTLVAIFLRELLGTAWTAAGERRRLLAVAVAAPCALTALWLIDMLSTGPVTRWLAWSETIPALLRVDGYVVPSELMKIAWSLVLLVLLLCVSWAARWRLALATSSDRYIFKFARRASGPGWQLLSTTCLLCLAFATVLQGVAYASLQLNGRQVFTYPTPFESNDYFVAPPEALRPPTEDALREVGARLEVDSYRSVLVADLDRFQAVSEPMEPAYASHIGPFWRLRLVDGYGPGVSGRLARLPWPNGTRTLRSLSFPSDVDLPWPLLSTLNVKYAVTVNEPLYYNVGPQARVTREARVEDLLIRENPLPVVPRQFFAASVRPAPRNFSSKPALLTPALPAGPFLPADPVAESVVEGYPAPARFDTAGAIHAVYRGGSIELRVDPADQPRFLVLNEMYHPRWRAYADDKELKVYATNLVMRGLVVPPGATHVVMRFVPFLLSRGSLVFYLTALALSTWTFRRFRRMERVS